MIPRVHGFTRCGSCCAGLPRCAISPGMDNGNTPAAVSNAPCVSFLACLHAGVETTRAPGSCMALAAPACSPGSTLLFGIHSAGESRPRVSSPRPLKPPNAAHPARDSGAHRRRGKEERCAGRHAAAGRENTVLRAWSWDILSSIWSLRVPGNGSFVYDSILPKVVCLFRILFPCLHALIVYFQVFS